MTLTATPPTTGNGASAPATAVKLGVSSHFMNKENRAPVRGDGDGAGNRYAFGAFTTAALTPAAICRHVISGKAICVAACKDNWRKEANFLSAQVIGIDFDHDTGVAALMTHAFVGAHAFLVYATPSSTPEHPRSRALFVLDMPIENVATYKRYVKRLLHHLDVGDADEQCKDGARIFFGSTTTNYNLVQSAVLPLAVLEALPPHPDELPRPVVLPPAREAADTADPDTRKRLLAYARVVREKELAALETVPEGMDLRHGAINGAVMRLIGYVKGGWIGFDGVEDDIRAACRRMGREEQEVEASIKGAFVKATPVPVALPASPVLGDSKPPPAPRAAAPAPSAPATQWHTSDDSMARFRERLTTPADPSLIPLTFPFRSLHEFGGFCRVVPPGFLIGIVGMSGGMKTSMIETLTDAWRQMDANDVLWWGPEWNWERMADRAVQRYGTLQKPTAGLTDIGLHEQWLGEAARGVPLAQRHGKHMPQTLLANSLDAADRIAAWAGKNHYVEAMDIDIDTLLALSAERLHAHASIRIAVFDYVQLMDMRSVRTEAERINAVLARIKAFCVENKLIGIVASQVTKSSSSSARDGVETLKAESGQFFRSDKFNLILTLNPIYEGSALTQRGVIHVAKNSAGRTGKQTVFIDPARFKWLDRKADTGAGSAGRPATDDDSEEVTP